MVEVCKFFKLGLSEEVVVEDAGREGWVDFSRGGVDEGSEGEGELPDSGLKLRVFVLVGVKHSFSFRGCF